MWGWSLVLGSGDHREELHSSIPVPIPQTVLQSQNSRQHEQEVLLHSGKYLFNQWKNFKMNILGPVAHM